MLGRYFYGTTMEGTFSTEPLIGNDSECVLVTGYNWLTLKLFRGHIDNAASHILQVERARILRDNRETAIREQERAVFC